MYGGSTSKLQFLNDIQGLASYLQQQRGRVTVLASVVLAENSAIESERSLQQYLGSKGGYEGLDGVLFQRDGVYLGLDG